MRVTSSVRAVIRSYEDAIKDMRTMYAITMRYGGGALSQQPADAQPFTISSTLDPSSFKRFAETVGMDDAYAEDVQEGMRLNPRPAVNRHKHKNIFHQKFNLVIDPQLIMHRRTYAKAQHIMASPEQIVYGSRDALKRILEAIRKKNLSSLSPLLLDDRILTDISTNSKLSSLTNRQLSCLDVSDNDFLGMDGIVDRWNKIDLPKDDPSGLLSSLKIGKCDKLGKPLLTYSVDMTACLRKKVLVSKMMALPYPKKEDAKDILRPAPSSYGFPFRRFMYATLEFAHVGTDTKGKFSDEPFLLNFHVHSF